MVDCTRGYCIVLQHIYEFKCSNMATGCTLEVVGSNETETKF
jgi:hypothetical protein